MRPIRLFRLRARLLQGLLLCSTLISWAQATALSCEPTADRHAIDLGVTANREGQDDWLGRLLKRAPSPAPSIDAIEVYGDHEYRQRLPNGWIAALIRTKAGWSLRLYDQPGGVDLSAVTPPFRGPVPNPRDVAGWHFRNADNTGPNAGSVNAPQHLRLFEFAPEIAGTGGFKPPAAQSGASGASGRGWLQILDLGLTDLAPGQQASLNYLKVRGCLTWPRTPQQQSDFQFRTDPVYLDVEREIMGRCGLHLGHYTLQALVTPRHLGADLDGDGAADDLMQLVDQQTGLRDIALCRAGTWMSLLSRATAEETFLHTVRAMERWQVVPADYAKAGTPGGQAEWPAAIGDVLVLERIEKSLFLVYYTQQGLQVRRVLP